MGTKFFNFSAGHFVNNHANEKNVKFVDFCKALKNLKIYRELPGNKTLIYILKKRIPTRRGHHTLPFLE